MSGGRRLLDQVRDVIRIKHYSIRTEQAYLQWIRRYILFHGKRHPSELGSEHLSRFLSDLAVRGKVAASTQNQALNAILFLTETKSAVDRGRLARKAAPAPARRTDSR